MHVPFNQAAMMGDELKNIQMLFEQHMRLSGNGTFTQKSELLLERNLNIPRVLLTTSCTHALEMSALLLRIQPGDEVIVPSFTFVSTANAFVLFGARPVFCDIRPDTLNLDETRLEALITPRTKAIVVVHYAGVGCEMAAILDIAARHNLVVIEDNAHGLYGKYKGKYLGSLGVMATQSFHETKNIQCGEGGALLINAPEYIERAEIIREKGTNRNQFFRGEVDKYTWVDIGSSYVISEILTAYLYAQLEAREQIFAARRRVWDYYHAHLQDWAAAKGVRLPIIPDYCEQGYHMYYILLPSLEHRQALIAHLKAHHIHSVFHYMPLNTSDMGKKFGSKAGDCPVTEDISDRLLRLPFYNNLSPEQQDYVIEALRTFKGIKNG